MPKKKLLFINGHLNAGGCERSLVDLLKHIDYSLYQADLLLLEDLGDYAAELPGTVRVYLNSLGCAFGPFWECMRNGLKNRDWFSMLFRLIYLCSRKCGGSVLRLARPLFHGLSSQYDAVIAYRPGICTELAAYTFCAKKRISWWHHGEFACSEKQAADLDRAYRAMDQIVAVSESSAELVRRNFPAASAKVAVIPNMICPTELQTKAGNGIERPGSKNEYILISVGRMSPEKNMLLCPETGKELRDRGVAFHWVVIGEGEEMKLICQEIQRFNLTECFVLLGKKANPYPYIKMADVLVHPSRVESQGLTILEAMALSVPVVAARAAGPCEYMMDGVNGRLVEADADSMADAIASILEDEVLRMKIVEKERETAEQFSPEKVVSSLYRIINRN